MPQIRITSGDLRVHYGKIIISRNKKSSNKMGHGFRSYVELPEGKILVQPLKYLGFSYENPLRGHFVMCWR